MDGCNSSECIIDTKYIHIQEHLRESETNPNVTSFLAFNLWCCGVVAKKMITFTYLNNSTYTNINLSFIYIYPYII